MRRTGTFRDTKNTTYRGPTKRKTCLEYIQVSIFPFCSIEERHVASICAFVAWALSIDAVGFTRTSIILVTVNVSGER